jgi:hypothetical protein
MIVEVESFAGRWLYKVEVLYLSVVCTVYKPCEPLQLKVDSF